MDAKKFEVGQVWLTRRGNKVAVKKIIDDIEYPIRCEDSEGRPECYTEAGRWISSGAEHDRDLVSLVEPEQPKPAPETNELAEELLWTAQLHEQQAEGDEEGARRFAQILAESEASAKRRRFLAAHYRMLAAAEMPLPPAQPDDFPF